MPRLTIEQVTAEPWKYTASQWQAAHNVKQPHIAEISPMQYAHLSKRGRAQYDAKRNQEWEESAECKRAWKHAVIAAWECDAFQPRDPEVSDEAKSTVIHEQIRRKEEEHAAALAYREQSNKISGPEDVSPGDRIFTFACGGYVTVEKVNKKSLTVTTPYGPMRVAFSACQWLSYNDLKEACRISEQPAEVTV